MVTFLIQTAILLTIAYLAGCLSGHLAHRIVAGQGTVAALAPPRTAIAPPRPALAPPTASEFASRPHEPPAGRDDLKKIRGLGRQAEARLNAAGITSFAQIAAWTAADQAQWAERLGFGGRIGREKWVEQAATLARGGQTEFSRRVEKGEVPTSARARPKKPSGGNA